MSSSSSINSSSNQILPEDRRESSEPSSCSSNPHSTSSSNKESNPPQLIRKNSRLVGASSSRSRPRVEATEQLATETRETGARTGPNVDGIDHEIEEIEELEEENPEEDATEAGVAEDNLEAVNHASPPLPKRRVFRPNNVPSSSVTPGAVQAVLEENGLPDQIVFIIPEAGDRPWDVPEGFLCVYLTYFTQCGLSLPIPSRLLGYCNRRGVALTQVMPASITNYVGFVTLCDELGEIPSSRLFEDLFSVNIHKSKEWFFAANAKPRKNIVTGAKPSKFNDWESLYFFLEMNDLTVSNSDIPTQSEWKIPIGRHLPSIILNSGLTSEFEAAFSEAGKRRWPELWEEILQRRASVREPKPRKPKARANKPRAAPRRKAPKSRAQQTQTARMLSLDEIATLFDEEEPNVADPTPIPANEGTNEQPDELPPVANSPDLAGQKKLKKKKSSKKIKKIEDSSRAQDAPAELEAPTAVASDLALSQDRAEASHSRKRQAGDRAEGSPEPEPAKRAKVCFDYDEETPFEENIDACADLYHKISSQVPSLPAVAELRFPNMYKGIARTTAVLASQTNNLVAAYEVALYDEQVRVAELEERVSKAEERLATELQINDTLHSSVDLLKQESAELKAVRKELTEAQNMLAQEFEKDQERLRALVNHWKGRARIVHAQGFYRLEKVIRSLDDADRARKPYLVVNQLTRVLGFIKQLKKKGLYEVPPEMVADIEAKHAKALEDFRAIDACVLTEEDKRMSPFAEEDDVPVAVTQSAQDPARGEQFGSNEDMLNADRAATSNTA
ncbi:meiosis-specific protein ASY2-like [Eutrema salsugineum]|uniref:meiosis-specific protein ASY2-like n=1 Tax=Eutrema salsugineum TaxID=72664 RepID=UPI000CED76E1|nr:meiosis-specific protein ASY2-like [Eutrema salsugineum]